MSELALAQKVKLDIGCGMSKPEGWVGIDVARVPGVDIIHDLNQFPWPIATDSVKEARCLRPDQRVLTPTGMIEISKVCVGDLVAGATGFTKVVRVYRSRYDGDMISVKTALGGPVVTENHPIATAPGNWVEAGKLGHSDVLISIAPEVEVANLVEVGDLCGAVGRIGAAVRQRRSSLAVPQRHARHGSLEREIGKYAAHQDDTPWATHDVYPINQPGVGCVGEVGASSVSSLRCLGERAVLHAHLVEDAPNLFQDLRAATGEGDHQRNARMRLPSPIGEARTAHDDGEGDGTFAVHNSRKPRKVGVEHLDRSSYSGDVFNIETEDHTFYAEGILTHNCTHYVEHLPHRECPYVEVSPSGEVEHLAQDRWARSVKRWGHVRDLWWDFWGEVYRVLEDGATIDVVTPYYTSRRADQDPTHERRICEESYLYLSQDWLARNRCAYPFAGDFEIVEYCSLLERPIPDNMEADHYVNVVADLRVKLKCKKPAGRPALAWWETKEAQGG